MLPHGRGTASWGWQRRNPVLGCSAPIDEAENPLKKIFLGLGWAQLAASARTQKWPQPRARGASPQELEADPNVPQPHLCRGCRGASGAAGLGHGP